jgi:hypothetical protein
VRRHFGKLDVGVRNPVVHINFILLGIIKIDAAC